MSNTANTTPAAPAEAVAAAATWIVNMENGPERRRLYDGHISRRVPVWRGGFRATDYTAADSWIVEQHTAALQAAAAETIQGSPALLAEARGWIADAYPIGDGAEDILTPAAVTRVLQRGYDGGCTEFVHNSAALVTEG